MFIFEDGFECINEALQEIKYNIFDMPNEPIEWTQIYWSAQLSHVLECYNMTAEAKEEDSWNINIRE